MKSVEFYYLSKYPVRLCRDYMKHFNIYDRFQYTWEEREGYYAMTFKEQLRPPGYSLVGHIKPVFKVMFEDLGDRTGIRVEYVNAFILWEIWMSRVTPYDVDKFWEEKLDAERIKLRKGGW